MSATKESTKEAIGLPPLLRLRRWQALSGSLFVGGWAILHLVEQGAALRSREDWRVATEALSRGPRGLYLELFFGLLPALLWASLGLYLLYRDRDERVSARHRRALAEDPALGRALFGFARGMSALFALFLLAHVLWWWLPKLGGELPLALYTRLRDGLGRWPGAAVHAVGVTAFAVHLWSASLNALDLFGLLEEAPRRRAARWILGLVSLTLWVLYAQLAGWLASGAGTFFPIGG